MSSIDEIPSSTVIQSPEDAWMKDDSERKSILMEVATLIVEQNVDLSTTFSDSQSSNLAKQYPATDSVYAYSCEVLSLGLLFLEFKDSIRQADGDRDFIVRKYFLLSFKATKRTNYSIEAFTLLSQYHLILAPHLAEQLKWSRFINTQSLLGHNISCDLHMEHLNRQAKIAIDGLGANKSQKAIQRTGKAIGTLTSALDKFDMANSVAGVSGHHSVRSSEKDLYM
jgi:L1 cell adhesion molecule like protein